MPFHRFETVVGHLRRKYLQRLRIGEPPCQRFGNQAGVNAGPLGQGHHLGNDQCIAGNDHLVAGLGHLPRTDAPHVGHPLTDAQQCSPDPFEV
ncbi:hypothetical protein UB23_20105 [Pseudomonas sp. ES3-33]|nr:hypothetical protein UB23_20105 [Pseudomonas sp. ES3-33]